MILFIKITRTLFVIIILYSCTEHENLEEQIFKVAKGETQVKDNSQVRTRHKNTSSIDTLLEAKDNVKIRKKSVIIPQVIPPDPDPEPEPLPDPYPGYWEPIDPPMPVDPVPPAYIEPVLIAEDEAVFPGGQAEMMKFINNNIKISEYDLELGCQGKVYVRIVVTTEGKVTNPEVLKGIAGCPGLSKSALDVVALMPDWIPALNYGQKVSSYVTFPIVIKYE
jgi:hypothetical protein